MEITDDEKYEFEANNTNYNDETNFTINLIINKTCYFKGEKIKGNIKLIPKNIIHKSLLLCPITATASLEELYNYRFTENSTDTTEEKIIFRYPMSIPKFTEDNLLNGLSFPFEFQIPDDIYPSCIIDKNTYVRHILKFDFSTIKSRKSTIIIIKNDRHFFEYNELYKSPAEYTYKTCKHKYAIFHMGFLNAKIRLEKNVFTYDEAIPIAIDLDCSTLKISIPIIHIFIINVISIYYKSDNKLFSKDEKICYSKTIKLLQTKDNYHIEEVIKLTKTKKNPSKIYQKLENDNRIYSEKYKDILLLPSCYDGLITCEYFIKVRFETDTIFSTDEYMTIPIDIYEKDNYNNTKDLNQNIEDFSIKEGISSTPKPMSGKDTNNHNNNNNDESININSTNDNSINDKVKNESKKVIHRTNTQDKDFINNKRIERKETFEIKKDKIKDNNDKDLNIIDNIDNREKEIDLYDEMVKLKD